LDVHLEFTGNQVDNLDRRR